MKRKNALVSILMLVALLVCNINITHAADSTTSISGQEWKEKSQIITDEINDLNGVQVSVDTIRVLYDVEINPTYLYIKFKDKGYAVTSRENMELIVYDLGCENNPLDDVSTNDMIVYGGGFSFYKYRNDQLISLLDNEVINRSDITKEQKQINRALLSDKTETSSYLARATVYGYTGLSSGSFSGYSGSGWINNTSNDCGSYCAAVLLAYFDDNVSNSYIPDRIRKQRDNSYSAAQSLVKSLIACIDPDHSGTVASEVGGGINNWLYVYSSVKQ